MCREEGENQGDLTGEDGQVTGRRLDDRKVREGVRRLEITGEMDRHALEAFHLEARRLARHFGLDVKKVRTETPREKRRARR